MTAVAYAMTYKQVRQMTDDELIKQHDIATDNTVVGLSFFIDEIKRREAAKAAESNQALARESQRLARRSFWLAAASLALGATNVLVAIFS